MTDKYPRGKLGEDDEGVTEIAVGLNMETKTIIIMFENPIKWLGFDKEAAIALANSILEKANSI